MSADTDTDRIRNNPPIMPRSSSSSASTSSFLTAPSIHALSPSAAHQLRAATVIFHPSQALHELLANAIDAGASVISILVDFATLTLTVRDNGCGMSLASLRQLGRPHVSSKCSSIQELTTLAAERSIGFRGEALSSMAQMAQVEIETRERGEEKEVDAEETHSHSRRSHKRQKLESLQHVTMNAFSSLPASASAASIAAASSIATAAEHCTYSALLSHGKPIFCGLASAHRSTAGATVTLSDWLSSYPVRRAKLEQEKERGKEKERMKRVILRLAAIHPKVTFEWYDASIKSMSDQAAVAQAAAKARHYFPSDTDVAATSNAAGTSSSSSTHLPMRPSQRIWFKPATESLLDNFALIFGNAPSDLTGRVGANMTRSGTRSATTAAAAFPSMNSSSTPSSAFSLEHTQLIQSLVELKPFRPRIPDQTTPATSAFLRAMRITGFLSHPARLFAFHKDLQFIYVNRHAVTHHKISRTIDALYERLGKYVTNDPSALDKQDSAATGTKSRSSMRIGSVASHRGSIKQKSSSSGVVPSPAKQGRRRYPCYLIQIHLPANLYDILFDPDKTSVAFTQNWALIDGINQALKQWLWTIFPALRVMERVLFPPTYMPQWLQKKTKDEDEEEEARLKIESEGMEVEESPIYVSSAALLASNSWAATMESPDKPLTLPSEHIPAGADKQDEEARLDPHSPRRLGEGSFNIEHELKEEEHVLTTSSRRSAACFTQYARSPPPAANITSPSAMVPGTAALPSTSFETLPSASSLSSTALAPATISSSFNQRLQSSSLVFDLHQSADPRTRRPSHSHSRPTITAARPSRPSSTFLAGSHIVPSSTSSHPTKHRYHTPLLSTTATRAPSRQASRPTHACSHRRQSIDEASSEDEILPRAGIGSTQHDGHDETKGGADAAVARPHQPRRMSVDQARAARTKTNKADVESAAHHPSSKLIRESIPSKERIVAQATDEGNSGASAATFLEDAATMPAFLDETEFGDFVSPPPDQAWMYSKKSTNAAEPRHTEEREYAVRDDAITDESMPHQINFPSPYPSRTSAWYADDGECGCGPSALNSPVPETRNAAAWLSKPGSSAVLASPIRKNRDASDIAGAASPSFEQHPTAATEEKQYETVSSAAFLSPPLSTPPRRASPGLDEWNGSRVRSPPSSALSPVANAQHEFDVPVPAAASSSHYRPIQLTRDLLQRAITIGQLDRKFIVVKMDGLLVAIDQHAADERRRLEYLQTHLPRFVQYLPLVAPLSVPINSAEAMVLTSHQDELNAWGFHYRFSNAVATARNHRSVLRRALPALSVGQHNSAKILLQSVPLVCGVELDVDDLREYIQQLRDTKPIRRPTSNADLSATHSNLPNMASASSSTASSLLPFLSRLPLPVHRVLNYKSCRSAVMFGDMLDLRTMTTIIRGLATCAYPFNCAHGRPTATPLVHVQTWGGWGEDQMERQNDEGNHGDSGWDEQQQAFLSQHLPLKRLP